MIVMYLFQTTHAHLEDTTTVELLSAFNTIQPLRAMMGKMEVDRSMLYKALFYILWSVTGTLHVLTVQCSIAVGVWNG